MDFLLLSRRGYCWLSCIFALLPYPTASFSYNNYVAVSREKSLKYRMGTPFAPTLRATRRTKLPQPRAFLSASSSAYSESSESSSSSSQSQQLSSTGVSKQTDSSQQTVTRSDERSLRMELPWSDFQEWALRDNLPRYTVTIPGMEAPVALWRTMSREVTELNGYPVEFLRNMHARSIDWSDNVNSQSASDSQLKQQQEQQSSFETLLSSTSSRLGTEMKTTNSIITPNVLPFLDEFEFQPSGGLCGRVYGLTGIADGTRITTTPVQNVQLTLPKGFVQTIHEEGGAADGSCIAYELGKPLLSDDSVDVTVPYSLDGTSNFARAILAKANNAVTTPSNYNLTNGQILLDSNNNNVLVQIGGLTTLILGGAVAANLLSHHLTINVFWV